MKEWDLEGRLPDHLKSCETGTARCDGCKLRKSIVVAKVKKRGVRFGFESQFGRIGRDEVALSVPD